MHRPLKRLINVRDRQQRAQLSAGRAPADAEIEAGLEYLKAEPMKEYEERRAAKEKAEFESVAQRVASLRAGIEAKRDFWLAESDLKAVIDGGGSGASDGDRPSNPITSAQAADAAH